MLPQSKAVARPQANFGSWTQRSFKHLYPQNSFLLPENGLRRGGTKAPISHTALIDSYPWILLCTLSSGLVADVCLDSMWESMSICIPSCLNGGGVGGVLLTPRDAQPHGGRQEKAQTGPGTKPPPPKRHERAKSQVPLTFQKNTTLRFLCGAKIMHWGFPEVCRVGRNLGFGIEQL